jgi:hypothetical protein
MRLVSKLSLARTGSSQRMAGFSCYPWALPAPLLTAETASIQAKLSMVLEIRVMHPALADTLVGQSVDVLEQQ